MTEPILTTQQQHVLALLAQGNTIGAAAKAAGVHRNTVSNWRRSGSSEFRDAWQSAQLDQAAYWRDHLQLLGEIAVKSLLHVLQDPKTTPSVRLKASLAVLNVIATPAPAQKAADLVTPELHIPAQPIRTPPTPAQPSKVGQAVSPAHASPEPEKVAGASASASQKPAQSCTTPHNPLEASPGAEPQEKEAPDAHHRRPDGFAGASQFRLHREEVA
jgi:hypothetical protein